MKQHMREVGEHAAALCWPTHRARYAERLHSFRPDCSRVPSASKVSCGVNALPGRDGLGLRLWLSTTLRSTSSTSLASSTISRAIAKAVRGWLLDSWLTSHAAVSPSTQPAGLLVDTTKSLTAVVRYAGQSTSAFERA